MIWGGRQGYGIVLMINLPHSLTFLIVLYPSTTCSCATVVLTSTFPNFTSASLNSISIGIKLIKKPPHSYNLTTLLKLLLSWYYVQLCICKMVTKLIFLNGIVSTAVLLTNITSNLSVTFFCN